MKKKQIIGLGTLLLVCLLGLFTTSFANITENQLKNYTVYIGVNQGGKTEQYMIDWFETATWTNFYNHISNYIDNDNYDILLYSQSSTIHFYFRPSNTSSKIYIRNMNYYDITANDFNGYRVNTISTNANNSDPYNSPYVNNLKANSFYTDLPIYSSSSYTSITFAGGTSYPSSAIFEGPYQDSSSIYFDMQEYAAQQYVDVEFVGDDKLTYNYSDIPLYSLPTKTSEVYFGNLYNEELATLTEDRFAVIYWYNNKWVAKTLDSRILNNYATSSPYLNISTNDLLEYTYSQIGRYVVKDCFYFYSIDDSDGNRAVALWYVESSNTVISGDKIDPSTFDNNDNYNNEVQNLIDKIDTIDNIVAGTEPIIDTITNDDDVSGELAAFISGDADDLAVKFGYNPIENPFTTVVLDIVQQLTDVLLGSGNATVDLSNHGINWVINSRDIYLPPGRITTFIHLMCNAWFIWGIYKYGFQLYQWIQSGRLQNLVNETNRHQYFLF